MVATVVMYYIIPNSFISFLWVAFIWDFMFLVSRPSVLHDYAWPLYVCLTYEVRVSWE